MSLLVFTALAAFCTGAQPFPFGGHWILDPVKSILIDGGSQDIELIVEERAADVTVTEKTPRSQEKYTATFDGTAKEDRGPVVTWVRTLRRERGALLWHLKMTRAADQGSISFTERWTLSPDGELLTVLRSYPQRQVLKVFRRRR